MKKFIFSPDKHVGFERRSKKVIPLHDVKAIKAMMAFAKDFKPDIWIEGGDNLDCGPVSHWMMDKKISLQDIDLRRDTQAYTELVLKPLKSILPANAKKYWIKGNHEAWLDTFGEINPGLASLLEPRNLLDLEGWELIERGDYLKIGKLHFIHGDTLKSCNALQAVTRYEHSIRFGHFHTHQAATKHSMLDATDIKTGVAVPGLCRRNPNYLKNAPNQWVQGFCYGYIHDDGNFNDYVPIIVNGKFWAEGKHYVG